MDKNIKFFLTITFCVICLFFANDFVSAVEYTAACPESVAMYSECTIGDKTGKCQLKSVNGKPTKICDIVGETINADSSEISKDDQVLNETTVSEKPINQSVYPSQCTSGQSDGEKQTGCTHKNDTEILEQCKNQFEAEACTDMQTYLDNMAKYCKEEKPSGIDCGTIASNGYYGREAAKYASSIGSTSNSKNSKDPVVKKSSGLNLDKPTFNGIVPCGTDATGPCTLCHLIVGIQRIFLYGLYLVTTLAFVGIFVGGAMYMISAGDSGMMESAKKFIGASLIGFAIVLGAWLIVNIILNVLPTRSDLWASLQKTNWYTFSCSTASSSTTSANSNATGEATGKEKTKGKTEISKNVINTNVACGDGDRGTCIYNGGYINCPDKYIPMSGGKNCESESIFDGFTNCCILESDTIKKDANGKQYYSCGTGAAGVCTLLGGAEESCPDGWEWLKSGGTSCKVKGIKQTLWNFTKCCVKK